MTTKGNYKIYTGLSGGFGGATFSHIEEDITEEDAQQIAFEMACEDYESYAGTHGLRSISDIMNEDGYDEEEAEEQYNEEKEGWIDYYVELVKD